MTRRVLYTHVTMVVLGVLLLTGCGSGDGIEFNIEGRNWPWYWPNNAEFADKTKSEDIPLASQSRLRLEGINGEIRIIGQQGRSTVTVAAELLVASGNLQDAQDALDQLDFHVVDDPDEIHVATVQPQQALGRQYVVNYTITVPSHMAIDVHETNGTVRFDGIAGSVSVELTNGSVRGTVELPANVEISLSTVNGDLDLQVPGSASAEVAADVGNGSIHWKNLDLFVDRETNRSIRGTLGAGPGRFALHTVNGNIDLAGMVE